LPDQLLDQLSEYLLDCRSAHHVMPAVNLVGMTLPDRVDLV
jgi:hypothetical protein